MTTFLVYTNPGITFRYLRYLSYKIQLNRELQVAQYLKYLSYKKPLNRELQVAQYLRYLSYKIQLNSRFLNIDPDMSMTLSVFSDICITRYNSISNSRILNTVA